MQYLGADYKLRQVSEAGYLEQAAHIDSLGNFRGFRKTLRELEKHEAFTLTDTIISVGDTLHKMYERGGGYYCLAFTIGLSALRAANPHDHVPSVTAEDWEGMTKRYDELAANRFLSTIQAISGVGLLEITSVNQGYVDGYQAHMTGPEMRPFLGLTGLAVLNAHDLMHFASLRNHDNRSTK